MKKILIACFIIFCIRSLCLAQTKRIGNTRTSTALAKQKATVAMKKPLCSANDYFPLCDEMTYVYQETNALKMQYNAVLRYRYFTTSSNSGKTYYGYVLNEHDGEGENFYYNNDGGSLSEYYEMPEVTDEYLGSEEETINIFKAPIWSNTRTINYYETHVDYKSGNFRGAKLLPTGKTDSEWVEKTLVDRAPSIITTHIVRRMPYYNANGIEFKDLLVLERKINTDNPLLGKQVSTQEIIYARGIGVILINDLGERQHLLSDFVKPNRKLISYKCSDGFEITVKPEAYDQLLSDLCVGRNANVVGAMKYLEKQISKKPSSDEELYNKARSSMPSTLDQSLLGVWKLKRNDINAYIRFNPDGTNEYYGGDLTEINLLWKNLWAGKDNQIYELTFFEWAKTKYKPGMTYEIKNRSIIKGIDPVTGERTIKFLPKPGVADIERIYIYTGKKTPW